MQLLEKILSVLSFLPYNSTSTHPFSLSYLADYTFSGQLPALQVIHLPLPPPSPTSNSALSTPPRNPHDLPPQLAVSEVWLYIYCPPFLHYDQSSDLNTYVGNIRERSCIAVRGVNCTAGLPTQVLFRLDDPDAVEGRDLEVKALPGQSAMLWKVAGERKVVLAMGGTDKFLRQKHRIQGRMIKEMRQKNGFIGNNPKQAVQRKVIGIVARGLMGKNIGEEARQWLTERGVFKAAFEVRVLAMMPWAMRQGLGWMWSRRGKKRGSANRARDRAGPAKANMLRHRTKTDAVKAHTVLVGSQKASDTRSEMKKRIT